MSETESPKVLVEREDWVGVITINRPDARNVIDPDVASGIESALDDLEADPKVRAIVLTGAGEKAFCAGGDLKEMNDVALRVPPPDFLPQLGRNIDVPKPTIAAVNGIAYGGGFLLAQQCDLVLAAEHARFAVSEVRIGRGSPWAAPLSWLVPPRVAMKILLTGDPIGAAEAQGHGLVNDVVPAAELRGHTRTSVRTELDSAPSPDLVAQLHNAEVHDIDSHDHDSGGLRLSATVDSDQIGPVMSALTACGLRSLTVEPPSLESLFLSLYEKNDVSAGER